MYFFCDIGHAHCSFNRHYVPKQQQQQGQQQQSRRKANGGNERQASPLKGSGRAQPTPPTKPKANKQPPPPPPQPPPTDLFLEACQNFALFCTSDEQRAAFHDIAKVVAPSPPAPKPAPPDKPLHAKLQSAQSKVQKLVNKKKEIDEELAGLSSQMHAALDKATLLVGELREAQDYLQSLSVSEAPPPAAHVQEPLNPAAAAATAAAASARIEETFTILKDLLVKAQPDSDYVDNSNILVSVDNLKNELLPDIQALYNPLPSGCDDEHMSNSDVESVASSDNKPPFWCPASKKHKSGRRARSRAASADPGDEDEAAPEGTSTLPPRQLPCVFTKIPKGLRDVASAFNRYAVLRCQDEGDDEEQDF